MSLAVGRCARKPSRPANRRAAPLLAAARHLETQAAEKALDLFDLLDSTKEDYSKACVKKMSARMVPNAWA